MHESLKALKEDLASDAFRVGSVLRRWRLVKLEWPHLTIAVTAGPRPGAPAEYTLRLLCDGYRARAPQGTFWDLETDQPQNVRLRPLLHSPVDESLKNFPALYTPFDREGLRQHATWSTDMQARAWHAWSTLDVYLEGVYDLVNSSRYRGINVA